MIKGLLQRGLFYCIVIKIILKTAFLSLRTLYYCHGVNGFL